MNVIILLEAVVLLQNLEGHKFIVGQCYQWGEQLDEAVTNNDAQYVGRVWGHLDKKRKAIIVSHSDLSICLSGIIRLIELGMKDVNPLEIPA